MGSAAENYYEILNVRKDCSGKEIRTAYVELSKKFHPDVKCLTKDSRQSARFLQIVEAYQTLSKPMLRKEYDRNLQAAQAMRTFESSSSTENKFNRPWEIKPDFDPNPGPYYGIKGMKRITNSKIALALAVLGIFVGVFGVASVKKSFSLTQDRLDAVSAKASQHHQKIRSAVEKYSKDEQLQRVIERISSRTEK